MSAYRDPRTKAWRYRCTVRFSDGKKKRISGTSVLNTKLDAERSERDHIRRVLEPVPQKEEVPTLKAWFYGDADPANPMAVPNGRFWAEWVAPRNKPSEKEAKVSMYRNHIGPALGKKRLDEIKTGEIAALRAALVAKGLKPKTVNNVLCVISKFLRYATDIELLDRCPKIDLLKSVRPSIRAWSFGEYARIVDAAHEAGPVWLVAVLLCGEAGLRVGETKALRWENVDLENRVLSIEWQIRRNAEGTPKGGRSRYVRMTEPLVRALSALEVVRTGLVLSNFDGGHLRDGQANGAMRRLAKKTGMSGLWHRLRHTFGTHAALFGVNPFSIQNWMGHADLKETLLYVHMAKAHTIQVPSNILAAGAMESDPDSRIIRMLGARTEAKKTPSIKPWELRPQRRGANVVPTATLLRAVN